MCVGKGRAGHTASALQMLVDFCRIQSPKELVSSWKAGTCTHKFVVFLKNPGHQKHSVIIYFDHFNRCTLVPQLAQELTVALMTESDPGLESDFNCWPLTSSVTSGKFLNLYEPQVSHLHKVTVVPNSQGCEDNSGEVLSI